MASLKDITRLIRFSKKIAIFAHERPDADAFCSTLALKELIETNFKQLRIKVDIFIPLADGQVPTLYQPIVGNFPINRRRASKYDLAIALDCPTTSRFSQYESLFTKAKHTINIDHHENNAKFAQFNFVLPKASSVGEMLYLFAKSLELKTNEKFNTHVYTSIITDTNCLTQGNIYRHTYKILTDLSNQGIDQEGIKEYFFKNNTKAKVFLMVKALSGIKFYEDGKIAILQLKHTDLKKHNATLEDTLGIIDQANNIDGVMLSGIIIENEPNNFYVSLRSKGEVKVSTIAEAYEGGGHSKMAAYPTTGDIKEVKSELLKSFKDAIKALNQQPEQEQIKNK